MAQTNFKYIAAAGETWDAIAFKQYKSERMAHILINANRAYIDTVVFTGGEILTVPIVETVETSKTLPPWRR